MSELWIALDDFPEHGREMAFEDPDELPAIWEELALPGRIRAVRAEALVVPRGRGALVKGRLDGRVELPCDRCAAECGLDVDTGFEVFEELPDEPDEEAEAAARIREDGGVLHLDLAAVLWEQLLLALPVKPVCDAACKGLCDLCGADLNQGDCGCERDEDDPRLAPLRGLKLS
jgi:uncharacterized protein